MVGLLKPFTSEKFIQKDILSDGMKTAKLSEGKAEIAYIL